MNKFFFGKKYNCTVLALAIEMHVERRVAASNRVIGALAALMRRRNVSIDASLAVHNAVLVPTLLYCSETYYRRRMKER